jgi:PTS system nitrogen regulatory IIA component
MQLTLRQAAGYLGVGESAARRWITERALPVHEVNERLYLNAVELWEWAVENGVPVSRSLLTHARRAPDEVPPISDLLRAGGIFYDIEATEKRDLLRAFVARLPLPPEQDRDTLLSVLEAREAMGSTGIGDGIAIPHVRNPIVMHVDQAFVTPGRIRRDRRPTGPCVVHGREPDCPGAPPHSRPTRVPLARRGAAGPAAPSRTR